MFSGNLGIQNPGSVPGYAQGGYGSSFLGGYQPGSISNILFGLFGDAGAPYEKARGALDKYFPQAQSYQNPFLQAGTGAIGDYQKWLQGMQGSSGDYQKWLQGMQNPSGFINNLMGQYQQSPWAKYQTDQAMRAAQNMGSATGLTGSTPLTQFAQQSASDISSKDMGQWLQNVLGINTQYGAGQQNLMGMYGQGQQGLMNMGQGAANQLSQLMQNYMGAQAASQFGQEYANQQQRGGLISGIAGLLPNAISGLLGGGISGLFGL